VHHHDAEAGVKLPISKKEENKSPYAVISISIDQRIVTPENQ
jgi:hypothetical protein